MFSERRLYEILKECYDILEINENVDEIKLRKAYKIALKKHHPDTNLDNIEMATEKTRKAYAFLKDEKNRKLYSMLKQKYENYKQSENKNQKTTNFYEEEKVSENVNKYIFQRRDGSKLEIQPLKKHFIAGEKIYEYKLIQYYNNMTIINNVYGRINLSELLRTVEYCDFCINNLLSKKNINESVKSIIVI